MISKPLPLKFESRIVPLGSAIDDTRFRYGMIPREFIEYVSIEAVGSTNDFELVKSLLGDQATSIFPIIYIQRPMPPIATVYLDIQSIKYKRPEMGNYPSGSVFQEGFLKLEGTLLSNEPDAWVSLTDLVKWLNLNKVRNVDYDSPDGIGRERTEAAHE